MKIPASFPLLGHTVRVTIVPEKDWYHGDECVGVWLPPTNCIELRGSYTGTKLEQVFCHELVHAMLDSMGSELSKDEAFVDMLASLLHQSLAGAKYKRHYPLQ